MGQLPVLPATGIVFPDIVSPFRTFVRNIINGVPMPHGELVTGVIGSNVPGRAIFQVKNIDIRRPPAAVALPGTKYATFVGKRNFIRFRRSEEHTSELQSLISIPYADFCLKKNK